MSFFKKASLTLLCLVLLVCVFVACDNTKSTVTDTSAETTADITAETTAEATAQTSAQTSADTTAETSDDTAADTETDHVHNFGEWKITKEATCTIDGVKTRSCACGESEEDTVVAPGHTEVDDAAVDATCTETGLTAGKHCSTCLTVTVPQTATEALKHVDANNDHKCDRCPADELTPHKDEEPKDHICDICNNKIGTLVDFTGAYAWTDAAKGTEKYERTVGGIKVSNKNATGGGVYGAATTYAVAGHVYEITYTAKCSSPTDTRMQMRFIYGSITSKNEGDSKNDGYLGWILYKDGSGKIAQVATNNIQYSLAKVVDRDINTADNNAQDFKVIVDGITNTMTLYAVKNGAYVEVDSMNFVLSKDNLIIATGAWDKFTGNNFVELSNVKIYEACADVKVDHLCDYCGAKISECSDSVDGNHACDVCGAPNISECKDANKDHLCDVDSLCDAHIDHAYASGACTACSVAEHVEADADSNGLCDVCGVRTSRLYDLKSNISKIKTYGRSISLDTGIACDFSGSGIEFKVSILGGDVKIMVNSADTSYYTLYINGERQADRLIFANGTAEYTLANNLAAGEYTFKLIKQSMIDYSETAMISLSISGSLLERPADNEILIEFVGDSITCGHSVITEHSAGSSASFDATSAYAYLTAQKLGADHSLVARSGWALLEDANGSGSVATNIYPYTSYIRSNEVYVPTRTADIVVIHLGTNDLNARDNYSTDFVVAAKKFIAEVKKMNPDAKIVWAYGSMMTGNNLTTFKTKVETIISDLGGAAAGLYAVQLPTDRSGGMSHPSAAGHVASAEVLAQFITENCLG